MTNKEAKIYLQSAKLMLLGADGQPVSDLYYAVEKGIEALETIPKYNDAYGKGWDDGVKATNIDCGVVWEERIDAIKADIDKQTEIQSDGEFYIKNIDVKRIIDKHCGGENGMSDLIDRQAVYDAITEIDCGINMDIYTDEVRKIIDDIPTVGMVKVHSKVRVKE